MARPSSPVEFVLSGGAGLGALQVGMLRALYERGIEPDLIVATSVGAINGAFIATRSQTGETADELATICSHVRRGQVFPARGCSGAELRLRSSCPAGARAPRLSRRDRDPNLGPARPQFVTVPTRTYSSIPRTAMPALALEAGSQAWIAPLSSHGDARSPIVRSF